MRGATIPLRPSFLCSAQDFVSPRSREKALEWQRKKRGGEQGAYKEEAEP